PALQRPPGDGVVVDHDRLLAGDPGQQVEDVVGVGVVVVDQQRSHRRLAAPRAAHRTVSSPRPRAACASAAWIASCTCGSRSSSPYQREKGPAYLAKGLTSSRSTACCRWRRYISDWTTA